MRCSGCGVTQAAACDCGVAYVPAGEYAAKAIADPANREKSHSMLAQEIGVSDQTVLRARGLGSTNVEPERRLGLDGKSYPAKAPRTSRREMQAAEIQYEAGSSKERDPVQFLKIALVRVEEVVRDYERVMKTKAEKAAFRRELAKVYGNGETQAC